MPACYPLLLIDAGNSRVKWALLETADGPRHTGAFDHVGSAATTDDRARASNDATGFVPDSDTRLARDWRRLVPPRAVWLSNVAGAAVGRRIAALLSHHWPGVPVTTITAQARQCGVVNHYRTPSALGSDRWAGMIAAHAAYPNEALLIATLGTATTLDAIDANGHFIGGMIAPGLSLMLRALKQGTAQLPALAHDAAQPAALTPIFAQTTTEAMIEGCRIAQVGLIETAWRGWCERLGGRAIRCIVAGGAAADVTPALGLAHTRHDDLVLEGLALIAQSETSSGTVPR